MRIIVGDPLEIIAKGLLQLVQLSVDYSQSRVTSIARILFQFCASLQGKSADPLRMTGAVADESEIYAEAKREKRTMLLNVYVYLKHALAFYADEYEYADSIWRKNFKRNIFMPQKSALPLLNTIYGFQQGLVAASMATSTNDKRKIAVARRNVRKLEAMVMDCPGFKIP